MKHKPTPTRKIIRVLAVLVLVFALFAIALLLPITQTYLGQRLTENLSARFGTSYNIDNIKISPLGSATFKDVLIFDHKQDTLIYVGQARMNALRLRAVLQGKNYLGNVFLRDVNCNIKTYKDDEESNMALFVAEIMTLFNNPDATVHASSIRLTHAKLTIQDQNHPDNAPLQFADINADIDDFSVVNKEINATINQLDTKTSWNNTLLTSLSGNVLFSPLKMGLTNAKIQTESSVLALDAVLTYPKDGFENFADVVQMNINIESSTLGASDLENISPNWMLGNILMNGKLSGTINDFTIKNATLKKDDSQLDITLKSEKKTANDVRNFSGKWNLSSDDLASFKSAFFEKYSNTLKRLGPVSSNGTFSFKNKLLTLQTALDSDLGKLNAEIDYTQATTISQYEIKLTSDLFDVGSLTGISTLDSSGFDIVLKGNGHDFETLNLAAKGEIQNLFYRDYTYDKIILDGKLSPEHFNGNMHIIDDAIDLDLKGEIDFASLERNFSFTSNINHANFAALGWIPETVEGVFSGKIDLALQGNTIDEMIGDLYIEQGRLKTSSNTYAFSAFSAQSRRANDVFFISLNSEDVANGLMVGKFKPTELANLLQNAVGSQYKNYIPKKVSPNQYVDFNFNIKGKIATALFGDTVELDDNTFIKGKINPNEKLFQLNVRAPRLSVKNAKLNQLEVQIDTKNLLYHSFVSIQELESPQGNLIDLNWINSRINDTLYGVVAFASENKPDKLNQLNFAFTINNISEAVLEIQDADFYFNNNRWQLNKSAVSPSLAFKNRTDFKLSKLELNSENAAVSLSASQTGSDSFSLNMNFQQLALSDVLSFEEDRWEGVVDGNVYIKQNSVGFGGNSKLQLSDLMLNSTPLGNAFLSLESDDAESKYQLAFRLEDNQNDVITASGAIGLKNQKPFWNINSTFNNYNLSVLQGLTNDLFNPFKGKANGNLQFSSNSDTIISSGVLSVDELSLGVPYLNTKYNFEDDVFVTFDNEIIKIGNAAFYSSENNYGVIGGTMRHQSFSDWSLDMRIEAENLNVLNTEFSQDALYYGNAFLSGDAHLHGPFSNLQIDVVGQTATGTNMFIPIQYDTVIGDVSFINFSSKEESNTKTRAVTDAVKGLQLNFDLDVTTDAEVEIVVDPESKSFMRGAGAGNLLLEIDTAGSFAIWGDFIAFEGIYNFKNLGLIDKTFRLSPGGTIVWEGDPYGAQVNMQAIYEVPGGANPAILLEGENISQKIPTEVTINLFGNLLNPETPTFEIDFPNASGVVKNELNYRLNDQERRQLQAISLLSQGSFINEVSLDAISTQTITNNLFQKASGVFDNIFANENDRLNLGLDYLQGDRNAAVSIKNGDRLGLSLSTNINERILIDGKVGVPVGSEEETTIIGDVKVEFLLNKKGTLRARVFNKENEFQYFGDELGYTQGLGVSYQVRFNSLEGLKRKIFKKNKAK